MITSEGESGYSKSNAQKFGWAGFGVEPLQPERLELLERHVVGSSVLDAGCGSGAFVDHFTRRGFDVTGVDKHDFCLATATDRAFQGRFVKADLTEPLPFADRSFDTTYCCDVLEHVDDRLVLQELTRITRRRIIFTVPQDAGAIYPYRLVYPTYQDSTHLRYYTKDSITKLVAAVSPLRTHITGEQPVNIPALFTDYFWPQSRIKGVGRLYNWAAKFLIARTPDPGLCMNWAVVLDFV